MLTSFVSIFPTTINHVNFMKLCICLVNCEAFRSLEERERSREREKERERESCGSARVIEVHELKSISLTAKLAQKHRFYGPAIYYNHIQTSCMMSGFRMRSYFERR